MFVAYMLCRSFFLDTCVFFTFCLVLSDLTTDITLILRREVVLCRNKVKCVNKRLTVWNLYYGNMFSDTHPIGDGDDNLAPF